VKRPHPASSILLGLMAILAVSSREGTLLLLASGILLLAALITSRQHFRLLVRRSRWLLLTLLILFGWLTPGTSSPGMPGATQEGLLLAAENIGRLLTALSVVAMLLTTLSSVELVAGLRSLLWPLTLLGGGRDRIAVRLALTLEEVEAARQGRRDEPSAPAVTLVLPAAKFGTTDLLLIGLAVVLFFGAAST
jgi:energy-coupling factor transport system permease protein